MPHGFRQRVAIAAAASDIFGNLPRVRRQPARQRVPVCEGMLRVRESLEAGAKMPVTLERAHFPGRKLTVIGPMQRSRAAPDSSRSKPAYPAPHAHRGPPPRFY